MPLTATELTALIRTALEPLRNPSAAEPMASYLRGLFPFLGIRQPVVTKLMQPLWRAAKPEATGKLVLAVARQLWKLPEREYHHVAVELLVRFHPLLGPDSLPAIRRLIEQKSWWDSVDGLAAWVVGPLVARFPELRAEMDRWSEDPNFWIRRTAILHQLDHKKGTDAPRLFAYCARNAGDPEFFIRKAIGWALRQYARTDPKAVRKFVADHPELYALSRREALKHL